MQSVVIDGHTFEVSQSGVSQPLHARAGDREIVLPVWTWADHRAALRRHLRVEEGELSLDSEGYAIDLLRAAGVDDSRWSSFVLLALWWAAGVNRHDIRIEVTPGAVDESTVHLGAGFRARLSRWSFGQRLAALRECVESEGDDKLVDPIAVVDRLLETGLVALDHSTLETNSEIDALDVALVHPMLDALTELSIPSPSVIEETLPEEPVVRDRLLRLCGATGWSPSRVLQTSAAEVDALLALIGHGEPRPLSSPRSDRSPRSRLHSHPDAVVLMFDEEQRS